MIENSTEFSFPVLARGEQSARNKAQRYYPSAEIVQVEYLGFYMGRVFVPVETFSNVSIRQA